MTTMSLPLGGILLPGAAPALLPRFESGGTQASGSGTAAEHGDRDPDL